MIAVFLLSSCDVQELRPTASEGLRAAETEVEFIGVAKVGDLVSVAEIFQQLQAGVTAPVVRRLDSVDDRARQQLMLDAAAILGQYRAAGPQGIDLTLAERMTRNARLVISEGRSGGASSFKSIV